MNNTAADSTIRLLALNITKSVGWTENETEREERTYENSSSNHLRKTSQKPDLLKIVRRKFMPAWKPYPCSRRLRSRVIGFYVDIKRRFSYAK